MGDIPAGYPLLVTAAIIERDDGMILMTQRPEGTDLSGLWEFPGGKVLSNEAPEVGLMREIREELDLEITVGQIVAAAYHRYPTKVILLLAYRCRTRGTPCPMEGQAMRWVRPDQLGDLPMPPADRPIVDRLLRRNSPG